MYFFPWIQLSNPFSTHNSRSKLKNKWIVLTQLILTILFFDFFLLFFVHDCWSVERIRRRQSMGAWATPTSQSAEQLPTTIPLLRSPTNAAYDDRLRGATNDLFELLERVQCSRLDDQRCMLPAYFSQVRSIRLESIRSSCSFSAEDKFQWIGWIIVLEMAK